MYNKNLLKFKKLLENTYPLITAVVLTVLSLTIFSKETVYIDFTSKLLSDSMLTLIVTIESALFGFLLTILALIFQMNNKMLDIIKEFNRFKDLVRFSKEAVYSSLATILLSLIILIFVNSESPIILSRILKHLFGFALVYNALSTIRFVEIFYMLAKSK
jgi:hypothetical protein